MISPKELLALSAELVNSAESAKENPSSVRLRAAASRAYYAGFHAVDALSLPMPKIGQGGMHNQLISGLLAAPDHGMFDQETALELKKIGLLLQQAKDIRVYADYKIQRTFSIGKAKQTIRYAEKIIEATSVISAS